MRRLARFLLRALPFACSLSIGEAGARGADPPRMSSLEWVRSPGAEACVGAPELALAVEQRLGRSVFVARAEARVFIEGRVEAAAGGQGFHAHVALSDDRGASLGVRDLDAHEASCRDLDEQLALVIALLIDPEASLAPPGAPRAMPPPAPPAVVVQRVPVPAPPPRAPPRPWRASLGVAAAIAAGLLPGVGVGLSVRGEIWPPSFIPIELGTAFWLDDTITDGPRSTVISLSYGLLGLCPLVWSTRRTRLMGCAAMEVGSIRAVGDGFVLSLGQERLIVQAAAEGRLTQRIAGPLEVGLGLALVVPFQRARFYYIDAAGREQEVHRISAVAGVVDAGLGIAFP